MTVAEWSSDRGGELKNEQGLSSPTGKSRKPDFKSLQAAIFDKPVQAAIFGASGQEDPDVLSEPPFRFLPSPSDRPEVQTRAGIEKMPGFCLNIQGA